MKILIAEDDLTSRTMLTVVTQSWDYEPIAVEDGAAAWEVLQNEDAPRLLLLDWEMPELDGIELCRKIRSVENQDPLLSFCSPLETRPMILCKGWKRGRMNTSPNLSVMQN